MKIETSNEILDILKEIIINPKPELDFKNNYELIVAVILSAQTTDKKVNSVTKELFLKYPDYKSLSNANIDDVIRIIKLLGLSSVKANNIINMSKMVEEKYNSILPNTLEELMMLPGVGRKTASVVLALGFNIPAFPVDTHLYRMAKRLGYINENDDILKAIESYKKYINEDEWILAHHLFLLFGRYHCKAIKPECLSCKLKKYCKNPTL